MKAADTSLWSFEPHDPADTSEVRCNECEAWSPLADWTEGIAYCEDCGDHAAMVCPLCGEHVDHVWSDSNPMQVRESENRGTPVRDRAMQ